MRDELRATLHELEIEHGHSSDHEAVWPVCARRHAVMDRARAALLADTPSVEPAGTHLGHDDVSYEDFAPFPTQASDS